MAVLASANFNDGTLDELDRTFYNETNTNAADDESACHGAHGYHGTRPSGSSGGYFGGMLDVSGNPQELYVRVMFKLKADVSFPQYGAFNIQQIADSTNIWAQNSIASVLWTRYGVDPGMPDTILVTGSGYSGTYSYSLAMESGKWYCIELRWKRGASDGVMECWINGTKIVSMTGLDTDAYQAATVDICTGAAGTCDVYIDDVVVADSYIGVPSLTFVASAQYQDNNSHTSWDATSTLDVQAGDVLVAFAGWESGASDDVLTIADSDGSTNVFTMRSMVADGSYLNCVRAGYVLSATAKSSSTIRWSINNSRAWVRGIVLQFRPATGQSVRIGAGTPAGKSATATGGVLSTEDIDTALQDSAVIAMMKVYFGGFTTHAIESATPTGIVSTPGLATAWWKFYESAQTDLNATLADMSETYYSVDNVVLESYIDATAADGVTGADTAAGDVTEVGGGSTVEATAADGVSGADSTVAEGDYSAAAADGATMTDAASVLAALLAVAADATTLVDAATTAGFVDAEAADGLSAGDAASVFAALYAVAVEGVTVSDTGAVTATLVAEARDGATASEVAASVAAFLGMAADALRLTDYSTEDSTLPSGIITMTVTSKAPSIAITVKVPTITATAQG